MENILQIILLCGSLGFCGFLVLTGLSEKGNNARIFKNSSLDTGELDGTFPLLYVMEFNGQLRCWHSGSTCAIQSTEATLWFRFQLQYENFSLFPKL